MVSTDSRDGFHAGVGGKVLDVQRRISRKSGQADGPSDLEEEVVVDVAGTKSSPTRCSRRVEWLFARKRGWDTDVLRDMVLEVWGWAVTAGASW